MTKKKWSELVLRGRAAVLDGSANAWTIGDLALEVAPIGGTDALAELEMWAGEIRWSKSFATLDAHRKTAAAWPPEEREHRTSFDVHRVLGGHKDRFALIKPDMTVREARTIMGWKTRQQYRASSTRIIRSLRDPETAQRVLADPEVRALVLSILGQGDAAKKRRRVLPAALWRPSAPKGVLV